jgi:hypothetical protein
MTIVRHMGLGHQEIVVANDRCSASARGSAMNGDELTDLVTFTDLSCCRLVSVFEVLWCKSDGRERKDVGLVTYCSTAVNYYVRIETNAVAETDFVTDSTKRPDSSDVY